MPIPIRKGTTMNSRITAMILASLAIGTVAEARTKLVTLPDRSRLVTSLENPNHTLLYEEREIGLQQGTNQIDFSWTGVSIDPGSVMIELLSHPGDGDDATKIISTGFPPNENALTWEVFSPEARTERIRVSYLLFGIAQDTSYEIRVNEKETSGDFRQYLQLRNGSGENLDNTVVRVPLMEDLSRSVDSGEVRRFLAKREKELPIQKLYINRAAYSTFLGEEGEEVNLVYEIANTSQNKLGTYKLPSGKVRIFGDDGMGSSIFLGEDILKPVPPGEKGELNLGRVRDVVLKRRLMKDERTNVRRGSNNQPVLSDQVRVVRYEIENFKNEPVRLQVNEQLNGGDWEVRSISKSGVETERKSINELVVTIDLPAAPKGQEAEKQTIDIEFYVKNRFPHEM